MNAIASPLGGVCVITAGSNVSIFKVTDMQVMPTQVANIAFGMLNDWTPITGDDREAILSATLDLHRYARIVADIEFCLAGAPKELQHELTSEVETLLSLTGSSDKVISQLLVAPLAQPDAAQALARECLGHGYGAAAHLVESLFALQPLMRRLTNVWLSLSFDHFDDVSGGASAIWRKAVSTGVVYRTLLAVDYSSVRQAWSTLAFESSSVKARAALARIASSVANQLYPSGDARAALLKFGISEPAHGEPEARPKQRQVSGRIEFWRATQQIDAIVTALAEGNDSKATRFLRELVNSQTTDAANVGYAVKSLCNVAQRCAMMFRTDFEYFCLKAAIELRPGDGWTLIQLANHYKGVGQFAEALKCVRDAESTVDLSVAKGSLADIYVRMGDFPAALAEYDKIPGAESDPVTRGARADTLRRSGNLAAAAFEYQRLIDEHLATHRVFAGLAELDKQNGRFAEAQKQYEHILKHCELDAQAEVVYRCAISNVLLRIGDLSSAYKHLDQAVQRQPFAVRARTFKAAVAGLLGDPSKAIEDLPRVGQTRAFNEWIHDYVRGLLLLMLDRYDAARLALETPVDARLLDNDADGLRRLAAAVYFLRTRDGVSKAASQLANVRPMNDAFSDWVRIALQYHVAVARKAQSDMARLAEHLASVQDADVRLLVAAIDRKDWKPAWQLEVRMLLRLAA